MDEGVRGIVAGRIKSPLGAATETPATGGRGAKKMRLLGAKTRMKKIPLDQLVMELLTQDNPNPDIQPCPVCGGLTNITIRLNDVEQCAFCFLQKGAGVVQ